MPGEPQEAGRQGAPGCSAPAWRAGQGDIATLPLQLQEEEWKSQHLQACLAEREAKTRALAEQQAAEVGAAALLPGGQGLAGEPPPTHSPVGSLPAGAAAAGGPGPAPARAPCGAGEGAPEPADPPGRQGHCPAATGPGGRLPDHPDGSCGEGSFVICYLLKTFFYPAFLLQRAQGGLASLKGQHS